LVAKRDPTPELKVDHHGKTSKSKKHKKKESSEKKNKEEDEDSDTEVIWCRPSDDARRLAAQDGIDVMQIQFKDTMRHQAEIRSSGRLLIRNVKESYSKDVLADAEFVELAVAKKRGRPKANQVSNLLQHRIRRQLLEDEEVGMVLEEVANTQDDVDLLARRNRGLEAIMKELKEKCGLKIDTGRGVEAVAGEVTIESFETEGIDRMGIDLNNSNGPYDSQQAPANRRRSGRKAAANTSVLESRQPENAERIITSQESLGGGKPTRISRMSSRQENRESVGAEIRVDERALDVEEKENTQMIDDVMESGRGSRRSSRRV
jgi:hypothetical protein